MSGLPGTQGAGGAGEGAGGLPGGLEAGNLAINDNMPDAYCPYRMEAMAEPDEGYCFGCHVYLKFEFLTRNECRTKYCHSCDLEHQLDEQYNALRNDDD